MQLLRVPCEVEDTDPAVKNNHYPAGGELEKWKGAGKGGQGKGRGRGGGRGGGREGIGSRGGGKWVSSAVSMYSICDAPYTYVYQIHIQCQQSNGMTIQATLGNR